ncbi:GDSL-type esterase/lipase family protein [Streptomyces sp. NPDC051214]|uniref:GDSL-type esterase/lipase family protein n=1 Tax=Streptomyces sp. NPDC051214 TaxID=3155282 RepID=UPI0034409D31
MREFVRGAPWWTEDGRVVRADPADRARLPGDTWERAGLPAGVRLQFTASGVSAVELTYTASHPSPTDAYSTAPPVFTLLTDSATGGGGAQAGASSPKEGAETRRRAGDPPESTEIGAPTNNPAESADGRTTADSPAGSGGASAARGGDAAALGSHAQDAAPAPAPAPARDTPATSGTHTVRIELPCPDGDFILHLPQALRPTLTDLRPVGGGTLRPRRKQPRWLVYGDSIVEGWSTSRPHLAWPALAGRALGVETVNLGYAGAARGELASAEQLATLDADFITLAFGTNCWSRVPHTARLLYETARAFLDLVRRGHPAVPLLVVSPVVRPDAETVPNVLGATLRDLRTAMERAALDAGADLLPGGGLLDAGHLVDGVHPGDAGHALLAEAVTSALRKELPRGRA